MVKHTGSKSALNYVGIKDQCEYVLAEPGYVMCNMYCYILKLLFVGTLINVLLD